jgi:hypothetical protein
MFFPFSCKDTCIFCIREYPGTVWALVSKKRDFQGVAVDRVLQGPTKIPVDRETEKRVVRNT